MVSDNTKIGTGLLFLVCSKDMTAKVFFGFFFKFRLFFWKRNRYYLLTVTVFFSNILYYNLKGCIFLFLGMVFFFDSALLALGDILFLTGLVFTIGT